jgi:hypothetical protein
MRSKGVIVATAVCAALAAVASAGAGSSAHAKASGVSGHFSLLIMAHTLGSIPQYSVPATQPWNRQLQSGTTASYRSIPCTGNAPLNNLSSDLPTYNGRVVGSRPPASMRAHPFAFTLRQVKVKKHRVWQLRGRIDFTVCKLTGGVTPPDDPVPDVQKPKIFVTFVGKIDSYANEEASWNGTFKLAGGTGRYAGLKGKGTIAGYFFCFDPAGCVAKGAFLDTQMVMHGSYSDPTPELTTG